MAKQQGVFAKSQPLYAEQGIATFPVEFVRDGNTWRKKPCVSAYNRVGLKASAQFAFKFDSAEAFGFMAGPRSGITILDVDTRDEVALLGAMEMWGETPLVVKTGGGFHLYYQHNGERRQTRFLGPDKPYDLLDARGFVVASPSRSPKGSYEIIEGTLEDLKRLPVLQANDNRPRSAKPWKAMREHDGRNDALFLFLMQRAHGRSFEEIEKIARTHNAGCGEQMSDTELARMMGSVWEYERTGNNFVGRGKSMVVPHAVYDKLEENPDAMRLLMRLKRVNWHRTSFVLANAMGREWKWGWSRMKAAITTLVRQEIIACVHEGGSGPHDPPIYAWV